MLLSCVLMVLMICFACLMFIVVSLTGFGLLVDFDCFSVCFDGDCLG